MNKSSPDQLGGDKSCPTRVSKAAKRGHRRLEPCRFDLERSGGHYIPTGCRVPMHSQELTQGTSGASSFRQWHRSWEKQETGWKTLGVPGIHELCGSIPGPSSNSRRKGKQGQEALLPFPQPQLSVLTAHPAGSPRC